MYPTTLGDTFCIQQAVSGTGVFNGTDFGRARLTLGPFGGGGVLQFAARLYGTASNIYSVQLQDTGATQTTTDVSLFGSTVLVKLRRSGGVVVATPGEVVAAINAIKTYQFPVRAYATVDTGVCDAVAATPITGGLDPASIDYDINDVPTMFKWSRSNLNAGFFHLEQEFPMLVRQIEFKGILSGTTSLVWSLVNLLSDFEVISAEKIAVFVPPTPLTLAAPDITVTDVRIPIMPGQALVLDVAAAGVARVIARREGRYPYL